MMKLFPDYYSQPLINGGWKVTSNGLKTLMPELAKIWWHYGTITTGEETTPRPDLGPVSQPKFIPPPAPTANKSM